MSDKHLYYQADHLDDRKWDDTWVVDELVSFVRTPEWSVSMLEDIASLVHKVRSVGPDFEPDDPRCWQPH